MSSDDRRRFTNTVSCGSPGVANLQSTSLRQTLRRSASFFKRLISGLPRARAPYMWNLESESQQSAHGRIVSIVSCGIHKLLCPEEGINGQRRNVDRGGSRHVRHQDGHKSSSSGLKSRTVFGVLVFASLISSSKQITSLLAPFLYRVGFRATRNALSTNRTQNNFPKLRTSYILHSVSRNKQAHLVQIGTSFLEL